MKKNGKKDNHITSWIAPFWALAGTMCLPYMLNLKGETLAISNSWFSVLLWASLWVSIKWAMDREKEEGRREKTAAYGLGCCFSLCLAFGVSLEQAQSVAFGDGMMWLFAAVWGGIFGLWIGKSWEFLGKRADYAIKMKEDEKNAGECREGKEKRGEDGQNSGRKGKYEEDGVEQEGLEQEGVRQEVGEKVRKEQGEETGISGNRKRRMERWLEKWDGLSGKKRAALLVCFFLLCWIPVFLAVYPGFFVYDAQDELIQVQTRNFTTHHPLPHVLLLGGVILAVNKLTGSYNAGIAVYTFLQMCLMSGVFTYVVTYMKKCRVKRAFRVAASLYFGFFPVIVMFALCSAKDGIFTGAMLLLLIALYEMGKEKEKFFAGWKKPLFLFASAFVMMCFRHNGMYAFLVLSPLLFFYMKGCRKKVGMLLAAIFAAYFLFSAGLTAILGAEDSENQEMLTVPIQQMARVYRYDKESLTEEEMETLYEIIPEDALRFYTPKVSDGVKIWFRNDAFAENPAKYGRLWLKLGLKHPFTYLNAWFMTSYGFWYPDTVIDVYRGNSVFTFTYEDSSFFGYEVEQPGTRESKLPWLDGFYRMLSLEIAQQRVPLISMLFSPGFLFWIFAFAAGYAFYRKNDRVMLPFTMVFLVWLTVILGPTYLPRYVLILWFALPGALGVLGMEG